VDDLVQVATASNEPEGAALCGLLESRGIRAMYRSSGETFSARMGASAPQQILVRAEDADAARSALAEQA